MIKRLPEKGFLINGSPLLSPDPGVNFSTSAMVSNDAGTDESGFMHLLTVRENVRKWSFSYSTLTEEEYRYLTNLIPKGKGFEFTFVNEKGIQETVSCYCKETSVSFYSHARGLYKNFRFDILEM